MNGSAPAKGDYTGTLHWATARDGFESVITIFNYLGWAFPDRDDADTDAEVTVRFFTEDGAELAPYTAALRTGRSLHLSVGAQHPGFRGMVATTMMPRGGMARRSASSSAPGRPIATSYFMLYERAGGFRDFSHELFLLQCKPGAMAEWATVLFFDTSRTASIVVMNNRLPGGDAECAAEPAIRLYALDGALQTDTYCFELPAAGSRLVPLSEAFPDFTPPSDGSVIATVAARNIEQPMSLHLHASGDFNIHHF